MQRELLGPGKYDLYRDGRITLADLVAVRQDPRWGPTLRQRTIAEAVASGEQRRAARAMPELVAELLRNRRAATAAERTAILEWLAVAPFNPAPTNVPVKYRDQLGARTDSLTWHLFKRIEVEQQLTKGTTAAEYVADLRAAINHPDARIAVYQRRGGVLVASFGPNPTPVRRRGPAALPFMLVVYTVRGEAIITGYAVSGLEMAALPEDILWIT